MGKFKRFAVGTLIAGAAGYVAGILTAPKSGKETRQDIKDATERTVSEVEKKLKEVNTDLGDLIDQAKARGKDLRGRGKDQLDDLTERASSAKDKVREMISAVREGEAEDRELQKAMRDASKAIDHLKKYLRK